MPIRLQRKLLLQTGILFVVSLLLLLWGLSPAAVLKYYSTGLYPVLSKILRAISGIFPFALGDILYIGLVIYALIKLFLFYKRRKTLGKSAWVNVPLKLINLLLILSISFKLLWGLNYSRPSITQQLNITNQKYNVKELVLLGNYFINKLNNLQPNTASKLHYTITELRQMAIVDYQKMAAKNPFFSYQVPAVKPVLNAWWVSKIGIEGYYNPLSGEANVNMKLPAWVLPFVTYHEISHQMGIAREDEANLVAYLVGAQSEDVNVRYAVNYNMLRYILLEVRIKSPDDYVAMLNKIDKGVLANFKAENDFWAKYNGDMSAYMSVTFDKFLKLNKQESGIDSYQHIVIWLWNLHKDEIRE